MKRRITLLCLPTMSLLVLLAITNRLEAQKPRPQYIVIDLGPVGPSGQPFHISGNGIIAGVASTGSNPEQAVLWLNQFKYNIAGRGFGGPNSSAFWVNDLATAVGQAQTGTTDPLAEDFCGYEATGYPSNGGTCLPFIWRDGTGMTPLPLLNSGNNGAANAINNASEVAGESENGTSDSTCPTVDPGAGAYQKTQFRPVVWRGSSIQELKNPAGDADPDGIAFAINDKGLVVGATGTCTAFNATGNLTYLFGLNIVAWQNGTATVIPNLGGIGPGGGNAAINLNNLGQVVGASGTSTGTFHGFVWDRLTGTHDVQTIPGDAASAALSINDRGQIVGVSLDQSFNPRAFITIGGVPTDLNSLVSPKSPLYLVDACSINASGEIVGFAFAQDGTHGYLAVPVL
jgi:probable HAF family extracellular repeat protein